MNKTNASLPKFHFISSMIAEWFWVGRIPPSGTTGSLATLPILWLLGFFLDKTGIISFLLVCLVLSFIALPYYLSFYGKKDHKEIVIDEVCGLSLTMCFLPIDIFSLILGFILFRIFDIGKPFPIHIIDKKLSGTLGIMLDDLIAGVMAGITGILLTPLVTSILRGISL